MAYKGKCDKCNRENPKVVHESLSRQRRWYVNRDGLVPRMCTERRPILDF